MKQKKKIFPCIIAVVLCCILFITGILSKKLQINWMFIKPYPKGVDISHYQGDVDMEQIKRQEVYFIYMKATEGSESVDERFEQNWRNADRANLLAGAYHFFSFDSPGLDQAKHYVDTVGSLNDKLLPVVDVEYYGAKKKHPPVKEDVVKQLQEYLDYLEKIYLVKPMIYTTLPVYHKYLKDEFCDYPLWIRSVYYPPYVSVKQDWTMWQYCDTMKLQGYQGDEKYIDMNVFHGSLEELMDERIVKP